MIINNLSKPSRSFVFALMMGAGVSSIPLPVCATVSVQNVQQTGQVKGIVVDANGEPIIGATIQVKDAKNGTVTDLDGHFVMANAIGKTLTVSYIGYKKVEVVAKSATLRITLESEIAALDEVVVIGYGTQRKGDVTSSVGSVKSEDFTAGAINDAGQLIQGKIAGLAVTNTTGDPTGGTQISLRGNTTILGASTNPLILVDGVPPRISRVSMCSRMALLQLFMVHVVLMAW